MKKKIELIPTLSLERFWQGECISEPSVYGQELKPGHWGEWLQRENDGKRWQPKTKPSKTQKFSSPEEKKICKVGRKIIAGKVKEAPKSMKEWSAAENVKDSSFKMRAEHK